MAVMAAEIVPEVLGGAEAAGGAEAGGGGVRLPGMPHLGGGGQQHPHHPPRPTAEGNVAMIHRALNPMQFG